MRLYSGLRDASPVLGAGVGAALAQAVDARRAGPRRVLERRRKGLDDADDVHDGGFGEGGADAKGLGRARARLTRAIRAHPKLALALLPNDAATTSDPAHPRGASLATRTVGASGVRGS